MRFIERDRQKKQQQNIGWCLIYTNKFLFVLTIMLLLLILCLLLLMLLMKKNHSLEKSFGWCSLVLAASVICSCLAKTEGLAHLEWGELLDQELDNVLAVDLDEREASRLEAWWQLLAHILKSLNDGLLGVVQANLVLDLGDDSLAQAALERVSAHLLEVEASRADADALARLLWVLLYLIHD